MFAQVKTGSALIERKISAYPQTRGLRVSEYTPLDTAHGDRPPYAGLKEMSEGVRSQGAYS